MKKRIAFLPAIVILFSLSFFQSCQSSKTSTASKMLKFNFEKGRGYDYELTSSVEQQMMGKDMKMDMTAYYSMNVIEDNGSEKTISTTFERMKMYMDMGPLKLDVDTDKPMEVGKDTSEMNQAFGMINKIFGSIKGRKFQLKVNAEGKVLEVTGFKEMAQAMIDSMGGPLGPEEKEKMRESFEKQFNDEGVKSQFERVLYIFPNKEVKVGDSWQRNSTPGGSVPISYNSTYTVKEIEGDMVTLEEKSIVGSSDEKIKMDGTVTGTMVVDSRSGLIVTCNQEMNMKVDANGMAMETKSKTRIKGKAN